MRTWIEFKLARLFGTEVVTLDHALTGFTVQVVGYHWRGRVYIVEENVIAHDCPYCG